MYLQKMFLHMPSDGPQRIAPVWVTKPKCFPLVRRQTWVLTTFRNDIGYLHTPTTKQITAHNQCKVAPCEGIQESFGRPNPIIHEWMMGLQPDGAIRSHWECTSANCGGSSFMESCKC